MQNNPVKEIKTHLDQYEAFLNITHDKFLKMLHEKYSILVNVEIDDKIFKVTSNIDHALDRK